MIKVVQGDITALKVDAIVNAANSTLLGGGGVDGAIHRAAGPELKAYCEKLGGCPTGEAKITPGFKLPAKYVIHTVGPVWNGGNSNEPTLLANCYRNSLELALKNSVKTIAFPSISTGAYGYPKEEAAKIAVSVMREYEEKFDEIIACCFSAGDKSLYEKVLAGYELVLVLDKCCQI
ncbi:MAG: O-acetyl-ADP-ribose deacetylase [Gammaproteobacteria bacterium]|nr:O-acetyl-ADP-ribose deacetylase [Gammaproteobacteria bacterium]